MKALVVRLSSIGDVVHTLPALAALRAHGWEVEWIVEPAATPIVEGHPRIDRTIPVPRVSALRLRAVRTLVRMLRSEAFDVAVDFQGLWKSAAWARLSGAARVVGYNASWRREPASSWLITEQFSLPSGIVHVIDKNLALLRTLDIEAVGLREFPLPPTQVQAKRVEKGLAELGIGPFAILNPGGGWSSKLWPAERYGIVARMLKERGLDSLVTWGPGEERMANDVVAASGATAIKAFPTDLLDLVELARRAQVVVAADTGPLQIACAVEAAVVGIFGPTDPDRNGPFFRDDVIVRRTPLCAPCYRRHCSLHEGVMKAIQPDEVMRAIERRLSGAMRGRTRV
ncbi:MAG: glycosyltransferase family 9 protein [Vicinamibacteria bacterium]|nr:glycosyltransferase family 9 protein [Vicinamibacteria bacterium]